MFEWQKFNLTEQQLTRLNYMITLSILSFVYILSLFVFVASEKTPETSWVRFYFYPSSYFMSGYFYLPLFSFCYMGFITIKNARN